MKKIIFSIALVICTLSTSFAQLVLLQGSVANLPHQFSSPSLLSNINKMVEYNGYVYAITTDQGIWFISTTDLNNSTSVNGWRSYNSGLPQYAPPAYFISDIDVCGGYLYAICSNLTTTQRILRSSLTGSGATNSNFVDISPTAPLNANQYYIIQAVAGYVYVSNQTSSTYDIRYSSSSTTTWSSLTMNPGGNTPSFINSTVVVNLSGGAFNLQWCCSNGLFVQNVLSSGAPASAKGYDGSLGNINQMACLNVSGVFSWGYLSQFSSGPHPYPTTLERIVSGNGAPFAVAIPPLGGNWISALATWNGEPYFGVRSPSGAINNVLYRGSMPNAAAFVTSPCLAADPTTGVLCMYGNDPGMLLVSVDNHAVWYTANAACKTDNADGISNIGDDAGIKVYPVPTTNELNVTYTGSDNTAPEINLYDMQGRLQNVPVSLMQAGEAKINVSGLSKGVYMLEFNNGTKITKRVVVD